MALGASFDFVMSSLLALAATHIASTTKSAALDQVASQHRGNAFKHLSVAVGSLNQANADAVLIASMMLAWDSPDSYVLFGLV